MHRPWPVATLMALVLVFGAEPARAESALWSLVATPLTATTGTLTTFSLTATNEDPLVALDSSREIGCIRLEVPSNFRVDATLVTGASGVEADRWTSSHAGNRVTVRTTSGGARLELLDWVRFTVTAMPLDAGQLAWTARAYRDQDCGGSGAILGTPPIVLVVGPAVTPSPTPTPAPTPTPPPTSVPTRSASPSPTPAPRSTPTPASSSDPASSSASPSPSEPPPARAGEASPSPIVDASPDPTLDPAGLAPSPDPSPSGEEGGSVLPPSRSPGPIVRELSATFAEGGAGPASLGPLSVAGGITTWIVPGVLLAIPGLLVIGFALLEGAGALAWMPAIRRLRGLELDAG